MDTNTKEPDKTATPAGTTPPPVVPSTDTSTQTPAAQATPAVIMQPAPTQVAVATPVVVATPEPVVVAAPEPVVVATPEVLTQVVEPSPAILPEVTATATQRPALTPTQRTWAAFIGGILVTIGGWYLFQYMNNPDAPTGATGATANFPAVVARVNGEDISGADLEQSVTQTAGIATGQGVDITTEESKAEILEQALSIITNTRLLVQVATAKGQTASEEDVSAQLATIEEQFGGAEALQQQAASLGLSNADLRTDIKEQIIVDNYLRSEIDVENIVITDEEINTVYTTLTEQGQELPPLESISEAIKAQLLSQKQQEAIGAHIDALRAKADIEILI